MLVDSTLPPVAIPRPPFHRFSNIAFLDTQNVCPKWSGGEGGRSLSRVKMMSKVFFFRGWVVVWVGVLACLCVLVFVCCFARLRAIYRSSLDGREGRAGGAVKE